MSVVRCPKCGDIITEEDVVARDDKGNFTFKHCGKYWCVMINACKPIEDKHVWTADLPTSQDWLYNNKPLFRVSTPDEDSDEAV